MKSERWSQSCVKIQTVTSPGGVTLSCLVIKSLSLKFLLSKENQKYLLYSVVVKTVCDSLG